MTPEFKKKLQTQISNDEGLELFPYTDINGHLSIGYGRNLESKGITNDESVLMLENDIEDNCNQLVKMLPFLLKLNEARQRVLINMCYNLGVNGFFKFKDLILALESFDYERASQAILNSKAAKQLSDRYHRFAHRMITGED